MYVITVNGDFPVRVVGGDQEATESVCSFLVTKGYQFRVDRMGAEPDLREGTYPDLKQYLEFLFYLRPIGAGIARPVVEAEP